MELKANASDVETPSRRSGPGPAGARTNPRSRKVNRSTRADAFAAGVRRDLDPRGPLESVLADHVAASAWNLKGAIERRASRPLVDSANPDRAPEKARRIRPTAADRAARSLKESLDLLGLARGVRAKGVEVVPESPPFDPFASEVEPNEWPVVPAVEDFEGDPGAADGPETPIWRDRLVFDFEVSDTSPVVKGTWITVGHVVSLVVDGETWADILRSHPELTEGDIRACVAYAVAQDRDEA